MSWRKAINRNHRGATACAAALRLFRITLSSLISSYHAPLFCALCLLLCIGCKPSPNTHWVATWATAEQLVEPHNCPPSPGLEGNTVRQIVEVSIGGETIRLRFSNRYGTEPVELCSVMVSRALSSGADFAVDETTTTGLTFEGQSVVIMNPGEEAVSDPISFKLVEREDVAIDIRYGKASSTVVTGHPGSRTTSYLLPVGETEWTSSIRVNHWYTVESIEVERSDDARAIAVLGNSITDGRGSTTNEQNRWTDNLSRRLLGNESTANVAVLNLGLGGNCVLEGGLGPTAKSRYTHDLFEQAGVSHVILFEGVNDLGNAADGSSVAYELIDCYKQLAAEAHERGLQVIVSTITPFMGNGYGTENHEQGRQIFNEWARSTSIMDGMIDFDRFIRCPEDPVRLDSLYLYEDDFLHPNATGYQVMADSIDLSLFETIR